MKNFFKEWGVLPVSVVVGYITYFAISGTMLQPKNEVRTYLALCGDKQIQIKAEKWRNISYWKDDKKASYTEFYRDGRTVGFACDCYMIMEMGEKK